MKWETSAVAVARWKEEDSGCLILILLGNNNSVSEENATFDDYKRILSLIKLGHFPWIRLLLYAVCHLLE